MALSGCGPGGSSTSNLNVPDIPAPAAASPTPTASAVLNLPFASGEEFVYAGTDATTIEVPGQTPTIDTDQVMNTATVLGGQSFNGHSNVLDFHEAVSAIDQNQAPQTQLFDNYESFASIDSTHTALNYYGGTYSISPDSSETLTQQTTYPSPNITDIFPNSAGRTWPLSAASVLTSEDTVTNGSETTFTKDTKTLSSDGSYTDIYSGNSPSMYVETFTMQGDGSGSQVVVWNGEPYPETMLVVGTATSSGIPITPYSGSGTIPPVAASTYVNPNWYPGGAASPVYSGSVRDNGAVALPAACNVKPAVPPSVEDIESDVTSLDTWGDLYVDSTTTTTVDHQYMAPNFGLVCTTANVQITAYALTSPGNLAFTEVSTTVLAAQNYSPSSSGSPNGLPASAGFLGLAGNVNMAVALAGDALRHHAAAIGLFLRRRDPRRE